MQTREDVLALRAEREPVAQLGPGEHRAGRVDARRPVRLHRERAQFVQAHIHLVGDIADIAAAAAGGWVETVRGEETFVAPARKGAPSKIESGLPLFDVNDIPLPTNAEPPKVEPPAPNPKNKKP